MTVREMVGQQTTARKTAGRETPTKKTAAEKATVLKTTAKAASAQGATAEEATERRPTAQKTTAQKTALQKATAPQMTAPNPAAAKTTTTRPIAKAPATHNFSTPIRSKLVGSAFETRAQEFLQRQRLRFIARNVSCRGGEIDLVMRDRDGSLVFVEVRARKQRQYGGAAASIGWVKKQRIVRAAQHYLATRSRVSHDQPACRFDVIAFEAGRLVWLRDAFRADEV
jgi:putative endonuclease